jgi:hypothetical protein
MKTLHYTPHSSRPIVLHILLQQYVLLKHHDSCKSRSLSIQHEHPRSSSLTNELQPINKTMHSTMLLICERPATKIFTSQLHHLSRIIGVASYPPHLNINIHFNLTRYRRYIGEYGCSTYRSNFPIKESSTSVMFHIHTATLSSPRTSVKAYGNTLTRECY